MIHPNVSFGNQFSVGGAELFLHGHDGFHVFKSTKGRVFGEILAEDDTIRDGGGIGTFAGKNTLLNVSLG